MLRSLDAAAVRRWYRWSLLALEAARPEIDSLNVFPVADSDTGTNLYLTLWNAVEAADDQLAHGADLAETASTMARLCLLGARGSSGVILSQLLRGVAEVLAASRRPPAGFAFTQALERAVDLAYAAVAQPVEGTMLTVARAAAEASRAADSDELDVVVAAASAAAERALASTPAQLDVLSRTGVVDAGGRGIVVLLDVLRLVVEERALSLPQPRLATPDLTGCDVLDPAAPAHEVMYLIDADDARIPDLRAALDEIGDAVVVSGGDGLWNVHVHTDEPSRALSLGAAAGRPHDVRVTSLGGTPRIETAGRVVAVAFGADAERVLVHDLLTGAGVFVLDLGEPELAKIEVANLDAAELVVFSADADPTALTDALAASAATSVVVQVHAAVQVLAAIAVHDSLRSLPDDVADMTAAATHTRFASVGPATADEAVALAVLEIETLLGPDGELVTVLAAADIGARIADALAADRPDVDVNHLSVEGLGSVVWLGVE